MNRCTCLFLLTCLTHVLFSQKPELVKDINPTGGANIEFLTPFKGKVYFSADDGIHGKELWTSDGTEQGTYMVKDIHSSGSSGPIDLLAVGDHLFFVAHDNEGHGYELWVSDGTETGTVLVKDIRPGTPHSDVQSLTQFGDRIIFAANNGVDGNEIWISDGTDPGTFLLKNIAPGASSSSPHYMSLVNGKIYFQADHPDFGTELWISDGTASGTQLLKDIYPGAASSDLSNFHSHYHQIDGIFYFSARDKTHGYELWKTDGTTVGTQLIKDIRPGDLGSGPVHLRDFNGNLYFNGTGPNGIEVYVSDGTSSGTQLLKDIQSGGHSSPSGFFGYMGFLYFWAHQSGTGRELWRTDGTTAGTSLFKDFNPGTLNGISENNNLDYFIRYKNLMYFLAEDGSNGTELWVFDELGDSLYKIMPDIAPNSDPVKFGSAFRGFAKANGLLYFSANYTTDGLELYKVKDTTMVTSVEPQLLRDQIQLFPNPVFEQKFTVQYTTRRSCDIQLSVIDQTGRTIVQISPQFKAPGTHEVLVQLPASIPTGIYWLSIQANGKNHGLPLLVR
ncbi:MAG: ELWxxDGT repeat protein [Bacteroidota bacterium]